MVLRAGRPSGEVVAERAALEQLLVQRLRPVRRRRGRVNLLRWSSCGLLAGVCVALLAAVARYLGWEPAAGRLVLAVPLVGLLLGAGWALLHRPSWTSIASAIDDSHQLKDRAATAWHFAQQDRPSGLQRMQMHDALERLRNIDVQRAAPRAWPRALPIALLLWGLAQGLLWVPTRTAHSSSPAPTPDPQLTQLAENLDETLVQDLEQLASQVPDDAAQQQELQTLVDQLNQHIEAIRLPGVERADALAELSDMQAQLSALASQLQLDVALHDLQQLGIVLESSTALQSIGQALQEPDLRAAAEQLAALEPNQITPQEAQALAESLQPLGKKMQSEGQQDLGAATEQLAQALQSQDDAEMSDAASQLASLSEQYALRLALASKLSSKSNQLAEAKAFSLSGGKDSSRSEQPRQTWGRGTAGDPLVGEATTLESQRQREEMTGMSGEGPSQREVVRSEEGRSEQAARAYGATYAEFRRQAEDVLLHEPLPLGHRQLIRQYFEAIRPVGQAQPAE